MEQLQNKFDDLINRMKLDKNKQKYNDINIDSTSKEEYQNISECVLSIRKWLDGIPTIKEPLKKEFYMDMCKKEIKVLEKLLNDYGW